MGLLITIHDWLLLNTADSLGLSELEHHQFFTIHRIFLPPLVVFKHQYNKMPVQQGVM
jgi:hypothetical protein